MLHAWAGGTGLGGGEEGGLGARGGGGFLTQDVGFEEVVDVALARVGQVAVGDFFYARVRHFGLWFLVVVVLRK